MILKVTVRYRGLSAAKKSAAKSTIQTTLTRRRRGR